MFSLVPLSNMSLKIKNKEIAERGQPIKNFPQEIIFELFGFSTEEETWENVLKAITYHEEDYENIPHKDRNDDFVNLLKAADALDRYRLPKMSWWINDKFLTIKPKPEEKNFAFNMVTFTEKELLEKKSYREIIIKYIEKYAGK